MGKFNRDNQSGGGFKKKSFDRNSSGFGARDGGRPQMHQATCSECGKTCEVPFRPTGEKPVYCSECFQNKRGNNFDRPRGGNFERPGFGDKRASSPAGISKEQFEMLNAKVDKILKILSSAVSEGETSKKEAVKEIKKAIKPAKTGKKPVEAKKAKAKKKK